MTDKTREVIKAEVIKIINRNPADSFDLDGCVDRIATLITAQADGVTDEEIDKWLDDYAFQVPYDGSNKFYNEEKLKHARAGIEWLRSKLAAPKQDAPQ